MAIKFKELNDKLENSPLSKNEYDIIKTVEDYIDSIIEDHFNGGPIKIELTIANFEQTINRDNQRYLPDARRLLMYKELKRRYKEAGWLYEEDIADSRDTYQQDYFVLKGNKK